MKPPIFDFPILDSARENVDGREVLHELGYVEPCIDEVDYWCNMPVRVALSCGNGPEIEFGPYTLGSRDIELLRKAIASYDQVVGRP
jgi:hypothetical protein